jgi:predicted DNA-binding mobile mystery protein A
MVIMRPKQKKLIQEQLDETLKQFSKLTMVSRPLKGWIRAIRDALGMNNRQLAQRLGVSNSRIPRIEQDEITGSLTLKTMHRVADELDCIFVYGFVPRTSLKETIRNQAVSVAKKRMQKLMHTMELEDQGLSSEENKKVLDNLVEEIINSSSSTLWEDIDQ